MKRYTEKELDLIFYIGLCGKSVSREIEQSRINEMIKRAKECGIVKTQEEDYLEKICKIRAIMEE